MAWLRGSMPLLLVAGGLVGAALASGGATRRPLTHASLAQKRVAKTPPSRAGTAKVEHPPRRKSGACGGTLSEQRRGQAQVWPEPPPASPRGPAPPQGPPPPGLARFTARYCVACHNSANKTAGLALDVL